MEVLGQHISTVSSPQSQPLPSLYEQDFQLWLLETVTRLKARSLEGVDWENLIEELEAMGRRERTALKSNLRVVLLHLLKYRYQPEKRSNSWKASIREHRLRLVDAFADSPSLKRLYDETLPEAYDAARKLAADETGLPLETFPPDPPFSPQEVLDSEFLPQ